MQLQGSGYSSFKASFIYGVVFIYFNTFFYVLLYLKSTLTTRTNRTFSYLKTANKNETNFVIYKIKIKIRR